MNIKKLLIWGAAVLVIGFVLIQLVPYGRNHVNPAVVKEPTWDSPQTRALAETACFDCHSNQTDWSRWYTNVAPASWLVERDVQEGRQRLNFSDWGHNTHLLREPQEMANVVRNGAMPPLQYLLLHSKAKLTDAQREQLAQGLLATAAQAAAQK